MYDIAVAVRGIGKRYRISHEQETYGRLTETLSRAIRHPLRRGPRSEEFWALRDISFDVPRGEVIGIIGRNGAGKSTLLKILSRITEPTEGEAILRGRVGSLLEVGTGFHPELTGRENIYLSGSILGMRRAEIRRRFDEIVAFAEVDRFLDTPVKRYSSGMQVRLGFAIAAHLEPEILVVDEVLAVGDAAFQRKSLAKMGDVAHGGRTVLFVSHNMAAVETLCTRGLLLVEGRVEVMGDTAAVVASYLAVTELPRTGDLAARTDRQGNGRLRFTSLALSGRTGSPSELRIGYRSEPGIRHVEISVGLFTRRGEGAAYLSNVISGTEFDSLPESGTISCFIERTPLLPGSYAVNLFATASGAMADWVQEAGIVEVAEGDFFGTGRLPPPGYGTNVLPQRWSVERAE
jgi:lipopolysaccharide transport system ATP-binding protein